MANKKVITKSIDPMILVWIVVCFFASCTSSHPEIILAENIFSAAPFRECHAATIEETDDGLIAAFFGGTEEKNPDVSIWICRQVKGSWTPPVRVADGVQPDNTRYACWNPVLYRVHDGPLLLFYKVGPNPVEWWGMLIRSYDGGKTWSVPEKLPDGILGPVKNKPVMMADGTLLCPSSVERDRWYVRMEITPDTGMTWSCFQISPGRGDYDAIQPSVLRHKAGRMQILCRSRQNVLAESWSYDMGKTWTPLTGTSVPNPNSGTDAVTLRNGTHMLVYNPTTVPEGRWTGDRTPLCVAISSDGNRWRQVITLENEPGEFSYPAVIQSGDGLVHIVYTWKRESIRHVVIKP